MKIIVILMVLLVLAMLVVPGTADDSQESFNSAGALYSSSVDLANSGKYQEALEAADKALALNVSSMTGLIQSNRAGILVMLHREDEAIEAADAALAVEGNLTTVHSIAWYNKGNALRALGRINEAQEAYNQAYALDDTLLTPDMSRDVTEVPVTTLQSSPSSAETHPPSPIQTLSPPATPESSLSASLAFAALGVIVCTVLLIRRT